MCICKTLLYLIIFSYRTTFIVQIFGQMHVNLCVYSILTLSTKKKWFDSCAKQMAARIFLYPLNFHQILYLHTHASIKQRTD